MLSFQLAWRNIWRNPRRSILTMLAVALAASVLVFFMSLQFSSYETAIEATVNLVSGPIQIQRIGYQDKPRIEKVIDNAEYLKAELSRIEGVRVISLRANGFALLSSANRSVGAQVMGVDPSSEALVSTIPKVIRKGSYLSSVGADEAIIGKSLAENLRAEIGTELTFLGQGADGSIAAFALPVVGIFETGASELDRGLVQIPLSTFQSVYSMEGGVNAIVVKGENLNELKALKRRIVNFIKQRTLEQTKIPPQLTVLTWHELLPGLEQALALDLAGSWLFYISLILIVSFSILNTFLMSVLERMQEFGVLLALGVKHRFLCALVFLESMLLTFSGLTLGITIGSVIVIYFGIYGFGIPGAEAIYKLWNMPDRVYTHLSLRSVFWGPLVIFCSSILSAIYPAVRIYSLEYVKTKRL